MGFLSVTTPSAVLAGLGGAQPCLRPRPARLPASFSSGAGFRGSLLRRAGLGEGARNRPAAPECQSNAYHRLCRAAGDLCV